MPALADVGIASGWAGLYEMTPDHNALVGEADGVSRFLYATGFSGHGFLMGPAIGEVLRDLVLGQGRRSWTFAAATPSGSCEAVSVARPEPSPQGHRCYPRGPPPLVV